MSDDHQGANTDQTQMPKKRVEKAQEKKEKNDKKGGKANSKIFQDACKLLFKRVFNRSLLDEIFKEVFSKELLNKLQPIIQSMMEVKEK